MLDAAKALEAAKILEEKHGLSCEIIDARSIVETAVAELSFQTLRARGLQFDRHGLIVTMRDGAFRRSAGQQAVRHRVAAAENQAKHQ